MRAPRARRDPCGRKNDGPASRPTAREAYFLCVVAAGRSRRSGGALLAQVLTAEGRHARELRIQALDHDRGEVHLGVLEVDLAAIEQDAALVLGVDRLDDRRHRLADDRDLLLQGGLKLLAPQLLLLLERADLLTQGDGLGLLLLLGRGLQPLLLRLKALGFGLTARRSPAPAARSSGSTRPCRPSRWPGPRRGRTRTRPQWPGRWPDRRGRERPGPGRKRPKPGRATPARQRKGGFSRSCLVRRWCRWRSGSVRLGRTGLF